MPNTRFIQADGTLQTLPSPVSILEANPSMAPVGIANAGSFLERVLQGSSPHPCNYIAQWVWIRWDLTSSIVRLHTISAYKGS
eukprot:scaffold286161_cov19-Tisochrysis_lutea.AAC.2